MIFRLFTLLVCFSWACESSGDDPADTDGDAIITDGGPSGDAGFADAELTGPPGDRDDDGIQDDADNCPTAANHGQSDGDGDGVGDACDNCPEAANPDQADQNNNTIGDACDVSDRDGDGIPDIEDDCPDIADPDQLDGDDDGIGYVCDNCPDDPNFSQTDTDGDGIGDACEVVDDNDGDGVLDADDNCPAFANSNQVDTDDDGIGDGCDNCPNDPNFSQADANNDGVGDACAAADRDEDGVADGDDNCPDIANASQADPDEDGVGSVCDNCPANSNALQADADNDGIGDACEDAPPLPDRDEDGIPDAQDNCPNDRNPDQADRDNDGQGDACDNPVGNQPAAEPSIVIVAEPSIDVPIALHVVDPFGSFGSRRYDTGFYGVIAGPGRRSSRRFEAYALLRGRYEIAVRYLGTNEGAQPPVEVSVRIECNGEMIRTAAVTLTQASASNDNRRASMAFLGALRMPTCDFRAYDQPREPPIIPCKEGDCPCQAAGCRRGTCSSDECQGLACDRLTGECLDHCAGVNCPQGQTCGRLTGQCQRPADSCGSCEQSDQCVPDSICIRNLVNEHFCGTECESDRECEDHEVCAGSGYCLPFTGTCEDRCADVACQAGLQCNRLYGVCQPERCGYNHDCPNNHYCSDGECLPAGMGDASLGLQCAETADCEPDHMCNGIFMLCARLCNTDRDCPQAFLCQYDFIDQVRICVPQF